MDITTTKGKQHVGNRLEGAVTVVTGSGSGIGRSCALMFARQGAMVVGSDVGLKGADETMLIARDEGLSIVCGAPLDLLDEAQVAQVNPSGSRGGPQGGWRRKLVVSLPPVLFRARLQKNLQIWSREMSSSDMIPILHSYFR